MKHIAIAILAFMSLITVAFAQSEPELESKGETVIIHKDLGGYLVDYMKRYQFMKDHGIKLAIDGPCLSACTVFMGFLPSDDVCITDRAQLGFHRFSRPEGTMYAMMIYPLPIIMWMFTEGLTEDMKILPQEITKSLFQECESMILFPKGEPVEPNLEH